MTWTRVQVEWLHRSPLLSKALVELCSFSNLTESNVSPPSLSEILTFRECFCSLPVCYHLLLARGLFSRFVSFFLKTPHEVKFPEKSVSTLK